MSTGHLLWKYYLEDDVEKFRRLLANASHTLQYTSKSYGGAAGHSNSMGSIGGSPSGFATSPKSAMKQRRVPGQAGNLGVKGMNNISRADLSTRDHNGLTLLHRASSSSAPNARKFALALIEHPSIDLYIQDMESGWTALHRALYFGNVTIARAIIDRDIRDASTVARAGLSVIKVKDHEGNSPFDVYNATIARRSIVHRGDDELSQDGSQDEEAQPFSDDGRAERHPCQLNIDGDEVCAFGSNKNFSLGFGDQDDRQHPERISLKRPDHLLLRFYMEYLESIQVSGDNTLGISKEVPKSISDLPTLIQNRPLIIQNVALSKLHSAILTTDPESNLYMCGFGPGGRLGTGDEVTRFTYVPVDQGGLAGKKVMTVALGQNHSLALSSEGEVFSFGTNTFGQLGYNLPRPALKDEEPVCSTPRQIFGALKREPIIGVAASAIHSVAHTSTSLFCWGKNEGQLGLMDSDSRSLEVQLVPRKVAASLFKSSIVMVSAINGATTCLLANHTVCVFSNYGYNIVKFPLHESFSNYRLQNISPMISYGESNHISAIESGGDTIAAISRRGDLFTMSVRKIDANFTATSTTNPSKIKGALSQPERVWSLRKGNWDGIRSVGISENGSVIVCTQAGAVWRRIKRAKIKDAYIGTGDFSRKDFKFQRVPGLTNVIAVRSTMYGNYAAIRKDCDVTKTQVVIDEQSLRHDIAPLFSLQGLVASEWTGEDIETPKSWASTFLKDLFNPLKRAVLASPDLEADVKHHISALLSNTETDYDLEVCTTTSDIGIPVHGFILSARSSVLRHALNQFRKASMFSVPGFLLMEPSSSKMTRIVFQGLDFITMVNLVTYLYTDSIVGVWHFTRQSPEMAFRYRQVRVELMKTAAHLKMAKLESAVRLMTEPDHRMSVDIALAIQDSSFFEDGDTIVELDGSEVTVHSAFLCQRCPFFEGLFKGRAGGEWLAGRREASSNIVRIDLKHISPDTFRLVLRYLYADMGSELFDDIVSSDIDEFSELVMDVLGAANELMLDRLSEICQSVLGRYVTIRNVAQLVNVVAPCSVTEFKNAALEYICLQLEVMLENRLLDDLEEDLLLELDEVVRGNQLNCLPFSKSGRAEMLLHERHPSLAGDIDEERQRRLRDMAFRANLKDDDRLSSSFRTRIGSLDDMVSASPTQERSRRKSSKMVRNAPFSPTIRPKDSTVDLMFDIDIDDHQMISSSPELMLQKPMQISSIPKTDSTTPKTTYDKNNSEPVDNSPLHFGSAGLGIRYASKTPTSASKTWSSPILPSSKLDMKEIMAQTSSFSTSSLSMSLSAQKLKEEADSKPSTPKISQKERKRQQQLALQAAATQPAFTLVQGDEKPMSPWQTTPSGSRTNLKDILSAEPNTSPSNLSPKILATSEPRVSRRTASPDTRFAGQQRSNTITKVQPVSSPGSSKSATQFQFARSSPLVPHSKSYKLLAAKAEPSLQLSMADIIGQQRREQEVIKEAVAKRSLQEIQEEQAFQEWWDQESRKAQEEEAARATASSDPPARGGKAGGGRDKGGSRGSGRGRGDAQGRGRGRRRGQEQKQTAGT